MAHTIQQSFANKDCSGEFHIMNAKGYELRTHTLIYGTAHITLPLICRLMYDANVFVSYLDQELCVNSTEWMSCLREISYRSMQSWEKKKLLSLLVLYTFPFHPSIRREIATTTPSEYTMAEVFPCLLFIFTSFFSFFLFVFSYIFFHDIRHAQRDRTEFRNAQVEWGVSVSTCKVDDDNGANNKTSS